MDLGEDIRTTSERPIAYYLAQRQFTLAETRMIIDSLTAAQFITKERTEAIKQKLVAMQCEHAGPMLISGISVAKTENDEISTTTLAVCQAIQSGTKLKFQYLDYDIQGQQVLRHHGEYYSVSPYDLCCDNSRYYVTGWHDGRHRVCTFRLDKIINASVTDEAAIPAPEDYDPGKFGYKVIHMYDGPEVEVTLECHKSMMEQLVDHYGR